MLDIGFVNSAVSTLDLQSVIGTSYWPNAVAAAAKGAAMYFCRNHTPKNFRCFDVYDGTSITIHTLVWVAVSTRVTVGCEVTDDDLLLSSFFWYFLALSSRLLYSILSFMRLSFRFFVWRLSPFDGVLAAVFKRYSAFLRFSFSVASSLLRLCIYSNE